MRVAIKAALIGASAVIIAAVIQVAFKPIHFPSHGSTLSGRVVDGATLHPVSRALIGLEATGVPLSTYSDNTGIFVFRLQDDLIGAPGALRVEATGYETVIRNLTVARENNTVEIRLTPVHSEPRRSELVEMTLSGVVVDEDSNEGIPQAAVSITNRPETTITDDSGFFRLSIPKHAESTRPLTLRASKKGYRTAERIILPQADIRFQLRKD